MGRLLPGMLALLLVCGAALGEPAESGEASVVASFAAWGTELGFQAAAGPVASGLLAAPQAQPAEASQPPWWSRALRLIPKLIVLWIIALVLAAVAQGAFHIELSVMPVRGRDAVGILMVLLLAMLASELLFFVPAIGPYVGGLAPLSAKSAPALAKHFWALFGYLVVYYFLLALPLYVIYGQVLRVPPEPCWARLFAVLFALVGSGVLVALALKRLHIPQPHEIGWAEFYDRFAALFPTQPAVGFGWLSFLAKPLYAVFGLLRVRFNDAGVTLVVLALASYFIYCLVCFGHRARVFGYRDHLRVMQRLYGRNALELQRQKAWLDRFMGVHPGVAFALFAVKLLYFGALYFMVTRAPEFEQVRSLIPVSDFSSPAPGFVFEAVGGGAVFLLLLTSLVLAPWSQRIAAALLSAVLASLVFMVFPVGLLIVITAVTLCDAVQNFFENLFEERAFARAVVPAVVILPLVFYLAPRGQPGAMVVKQPPVADAPRVESEKPEESKSREEAPPRKPSEPEPAPGVRTGPAPADLASRLALLTGKGNWQDALQQIDAELAARPGDGQLRLLKRDTLRQAAAAIVQSNGERFQAFTYLDQARRLDPASGPVKELLADIYFQAGREERSHVCVRKEPSEFASLLQYVEQGQMLPVRAGEPKPPRWLPVEAGSAPGWIYEPLVELIATEAGGQEARVTGKRALAEVNAILDKAVELNPGLRWRVFLVLYGRYTIAGLVVVGVLVFLLLKIKKIL